MKTKSLSKKLLLSKTTVADLSKAELNQINGGLSGLSCITLCVKCPPNTVTD